MPFTDNYQNSVKALHAEGLQKVGQCQRYNGGCCLAMGDTECASAQVSWHLWPRWQREYSSHSEEGAVSQVETLNKGYSWERTLHGPWGAPRTDWGSSGATFRMATWHQLHVRGHVLGGGRLTSGKQKI